MSKILLSEIDVNKLKIHLKDKQKVMRTLWYPGEFNAHQDFDFVRKYISIKDPIEVARRAKAYAALVNTHDSKNPTNYTEEFAIIENQLFSVGFDSQQVHDISETKANVEIFPEEDIDKYGYRFDVRVTNV